MQLKKAGWRVAESDPLKITIEIPNGVSSSDLTQTLRENHIECEFADPDYIVFMVTPENTKEDLQKLVEVLGCNHYLYSKKEAVAMVFAKSVMSIREAMFSLPECVSVSEAENRICRVPTVSCPPAIPIVVSGERISAQTSRARVLRCEDKGQELKEE